LVFSRRFFLTAAVGVVAVPSALFGKEEAPPVLDHILLGCSDLQAGIAFVQKQTGVLAKFGGVHPGRGTQNALLSLGQRHYLEIISPDPKQAAAKNAMVDGLRALQEPRIVGWAAHPGDLNALAQRLRADNIAFTGPTPGSRKRPDGKTLRWQTLNLTNDEGGLLPFFIQWSADSTHPSVDAPAGCTLASFTGQAPYPQNFAKELRTLGLDFPILEAEKRGLKCVIEGPSGKLELSS
jgi:hypothetical protein